MCVDMHADSGWDVDADMGKDGAGYVGVYEDMTVYVEVDVDVDLDVDVDVDVDAGVDVYVYGCGWTC